MSNSKILITGIAGFIGFHLAKKLATIYPNSNIIGIDNINDYYDIKLKQDRLKILQKYPNISFFKQDITDLKSLKKLSKLHPDINLIFHLAAQAGVRYSVDKPFDYINSNITGQVAILEFSKELKNLEKIIYASSSSVYGASDEEIFSEDQKINTPLSLYSATKISNELISHTYSRLINIAMIGIRFFTVYGPLGRPDMAIYKIANNIKNNKIVNLVHNGQVKRDFTYIDDAINGLIKTINYQVKKDQNGFQNEIFNLGNSNIINLNQLTEIISKNLNIAAKIKYVKIHETDMLKTHSNNKKAQKLLNYQPQTNIESGIKEYINWFEKYYY